MPGHDSEYESPRKIEPPQQTTTRAAAMSLRKSLSTRNIDADALQVDPQLVRQRSMRDRSDVPSPEPIEQSHTEIAPVKKAPSQAQLGRLHSVRAPASDPESSRKSTIKRDVKWNLETERVDKYLQETQKDSESGFKFMGLTYKRRQIGIQFLDLSLSIRIQQRRSI